MRRSLALRILVRLYAVINRIVPWHRLPRLLGAFNLLAFRTVLREENLHDTSHVPVTNPAGRAQPPPHDSRWRIYRSLDGTFNDLDKPEMGSTAAEPQPGQPDQANPGARFARNVPLHRTFPETGSRMLQPSPRVISCRLLARDTFKPATSLNLLAAAWIQFQVHDWFAHGTPVQGNEFQIPLEPGDPWPQNPMRIRRTRPDPTRNPADPTDCHWPPTYVNAGSHWWDASQIYGTNDATLTTLRTDPNNQQIVKDGKLVLPNGRLKVDPNTGEEISGFTDNWWLGLSLLHTLFSLEHNAICKRLHDEYPNWPDERLLYTARLINAALMAKIHTVEWTPAILNHPTMHLSMRANWWGLAGERMYRWFGRISASEWISGIPGSPVDHHGADYAFTEEFVSIYRMHPLMPDAIQVRSVANGTFIKEFDMPQVLGARARAPFDDGITMPDVFYSFGVLHPGAITLHNYPNFLRELDKPNAGGTIDLAAVDILRDRERGVPRYNEFRRLVHLPPVTSFRQLTKNPAWADELRDVYHDDINLVDLMVGLFAETPPKGFGFSDTAFRIFILMASRRLKSDRFFTTDYKRNVYSPVGMDWIDDNGMLSVLKRHYPELEPALRGAKNAFAPWRRIR